MQLKSHLLIIVLFCSSIITSAQSVVTVGQGSYASAPPAYKGKTDQHDGYNASLMLSRTIYCDEQANRPIPTNDWWTDIINSRFSGALWSYPAMVHTGDYGVRIDYPSYWADEGKEVKSKSSLTVSALSFSPAAAIATEWHDLDVTFRMPDQRHAEAEMTVTMAHGVPFTWLQFANLTPVITASGEPTLFGQNPKQGYCGIKIGGDLYGVYFPAETAIKQNKNTLQFGDADWLVVALLTQESDLHTFAPYAPGIITNSEVSWRYAQTSSTISTEWNITTRSLRTDGDTTPVLLGLLPHVYKYSTLLPASFNGITYQTPRGTMRLFADNSGHFSFSYPFSGILPYYGPLSDDDSLVDGFKESIMATLMQSYADGGSFGADTYWGGKGLTQMALNMTFAKMSNRSEIYQKSKSKLKEALINWLTYTPGEDSMFFSYYPRWGSMLGFNVSYDSDAFNDHHFHYGYFTYAAALLCLEDEAFAEAYGELLTMIAKDYANYDREDTRFPFLRTLDPWAGHSWAGGLGDNGNDNGNGQESTSEAMQAWGGLYLLGVALGDTQMRDAGIWGWATEARATREYWFDVDAPRPANAGGRQAWAGKGDKKGNYDYSQYKYAYNSNITGKGIGWWTWFGGDPLFMHGIQWMPASPALDYLSWDSDFVDWAYTDMMSGANSTYSHDWFAATYNNDNGEAIQALADNDWGNVTLAYMQRSRPREAAAIFSRALQQKRHIATSVSTSHISYYLIHHHLQYGDIDFDITADTPTATAYVKDGKYSYMVYNPGAEEKTINFYKDGTLVKTVLAPGRRLSVFTAEAVPTAISMMWEDSDIIAPGETGKLSFKLLDQYGATAAAPHAISFTTDTQGVTITDQGVVTVTPTVKKGTTVIITATWQALTQTITLTVNDPRKIVEYTIPSLPDYIERGSTLQLELQSTDQYGTVTDVSVAKWQLTSTETRTIPARFTAKQPGKYTLSAFSNKNATTPIYTTPIVILPAFSNRALHAAAYSSSEENVGSATGNINDGDHTTRWGSKHTDNEWIVLDFGEDTYISGVLAAWEAAYASDYVYQLAPDNAALTDYTASYATGSKKIRVPAESEWQTVAGIEGNSSRTVKTNINASGRYLRLKGVKRATNYGYSLYELTVNGFPTSIAAGTPVGMDLGAPDVADQHTTITLHPVAYTLSGDITAVDAQFTANLPAHFSGNQFTPLEYGNYTITATSATGLTSTADIFVNEGIRLASITLSPAQAQGLVNDDIGLTLSAKNQFGGAISADEADINIKISVDGSSLPVAQTIARYDWQEGIFRASVKGDYLVSVNDGMAEAHVKVSEVSEANLAAAAMATASSSVGGNSASNINDSNATTRWESEHKDDQWVALNLGSPFLINKAIMNWEGAYARDYSISISMDGNTWWDIYRQPAGKGGTETIELPTLPATMVRLNCHKRATVYGNSLYEWQIYGAARYEKTDDGTAPDLLQFSITTGNGTATVAAEATDNSGYVFYHLMLLLPDGTLVQETTGAAASGDTFFWEADNLYPNTPYTVKAYITDPFGNSTEAESTFDAQVDLTGKNIALNKTASASSAENAGLEAEYAIDGDLATRWGSQFNDNEALTIDLENIYNLVRLRILWDQTAYATDYLVETSEDGIDFTPLYRRTAWKGEADDNKCRPDTYNISDKCYARYIRITGLKRATQYGTSIREAEAYADNDFSRFVTGVCDATVSTPLPCGNVYNMQGILVRDGKQALPARPLPGGIYIVNGKKVVVP